MDQTDYRKSFLGVFPWYLELSRSKRCVLGVIGNIRGNPLNLIFTNLSGLKLFLRQFSKLVDQTDCRKLFFDVFSWYLVLLMSEQKFLRVVENFRRNPMNLISTNLLALRLFPCQFSKLLDRTYYRKSFLGVLPSSSYQCQNGVFFELVEILEEISWILFLLTCLDSGYFWIKFWI